MNNNRQALLLVTHRLNDSLIEKLHVLKSAFEPYGDTFFVYQKDSEYLSEKDIQKLDALNAVGFTIEDLCTLGYEALEETIIPGSNHFITMWFWKQYPGYSHYWNVEYDVEFAGDWRELFSALAESNADFIATRMERYKDNPYWYWWPAFKSIGGYVPYRERVKSFNPIYRLSDRAFSHLDLRFRTGWGGHHEVTIPTILDRDGFKIEDIGACGAFTPEERRGMFYDADVPDPLGTMRHAPVFKRDEIVPDSHMLYHPVKD